MAGKGKPHFIVIFLHFVAAGLFMALVTNAVFTGQLRLHPDGKQLKLSTYNSKLEFVLKYQAPGLLILLLSVINVGRLRGSTPANNPLSGNEHYTQAAKNILTNTLEQYVIHLVSQLTVAAYVDGLTLIKVVPLMTLFFFIGRVLFYIGYPTQRAFGWLLCFVPNTAAVCYSAYRFLLMIGVLV